VKVPIWFNSNFGLALYGSLRFIRSFVKLIYNMLKTRNVFSYILMSLVIVVVIMALLGIWEVIEWSFFKMYFWRCIKSLLVILFGGLVIYIIQSIFFKPESPFQNNNGKEGV
jgi:hypothetical protein